MSNTTTPFKLDPTNLRRAGEVLTQQCYGAALAAGWHTNLKTGLPSNHNIGERLMLIVSEIAEGMEGARKDLADDHLPYREMLEVKLAAAVIRIFDTAGYLKYDLGATIAEKMVYNAERADHKPEARLAPGGKAF